ncbi:MULTISPECIES: hypothetical protein [Streptomyces]|uniref:Integral membrane protein n=1 Tax=Streptomyces lienomycini TaxID=284035 RepID=A0ABV9X237_9ACTN|nr:hypothetical protein [Streptomyces lienomycini]
MSGDQPYAEHEGAVLLLLLLAGLVAVVWLTVRAVTGLVRGRRNGTTLLGPVAVLAWDAAVGMYTWGLLHLFFFDDHAQAKACATAVGGRVTGYEPTFVPLHFGCRTGDGRVTEAVVPSYLNPATLLLGICALVLTGLVIAHHKKSTRT